MKNVMISVMMMMTKIFAMVIIKTIMLVNMWISIVIIISINQTGDHFHGPSKLVRTKHHISHTLRGLACLPSSSSSLGLPASIISIAIAIAIIFTIVVIITIIFIMIEWSSL